MAFIEVNYFSDVLGMGMSMNVVLPDNAKDGETFPVLFLLHDHGGDHTTFIRSTSVERYAEERRIVVVMPDAYIGCYTNMKHGYKYRDYIGDEMPKIVRSFFKCVSKDRSDTYIAGVGMGGFGAAAAALTYPETFALSAPISGAFDPRYILDEPDLMPTKFWFEDVFGPITEFDGSDGDLYALAENAKDSKELPEFLISCAENSKFAAENSKICAHLTSLGYAVTQWASVGEDSWMYCDAAVMNILDCIAGKRKEI